MRTRGPFRLELHNRLFAAAPATRRESAAVVIAIAFVFTVLLVLLHVAGMTEAFDWEALARRVRDALAARPLTALVVPALVLVALALQVGYLALVRRRERLILTESELRYRSPLPGPLEALQPGWMLRWDEVSRARLRRRRFASGPLAVELELVSLRGTRRVVPWKWIDPQAMRSLAPLEALREARALAGPQMLAYVHTSPLMQFANARLARIEADAALQSDSRGYALERSPRALAMVVLFFALLGYAIADSMLITEAYAGEPPWNLMAGLGLFGGGLAWLWLRAGEVPVLERSVLALLVGGALAGALHPGLLRANAATDPDGPQAFEYRLTRDYRLAPPRAGLPPLDFSRYWEYWQQFKPGSTHEIVLRRGALEFWQVDMAPLRARMRAFYGERR